MTVDRFKKLYRNPSLCAYIKGQAARHFPQDGFDDACQEAWLAVWTSAGYLPMDDIMRIAYQAINTYYKGERPERHLSLEELDIFHSIGER